MFIAVTCPVLLTVKESIAVNVAPYPGETEDVVGVVVVESWTILNSFVLVAYDVVMYVPPVKLTVSPLTIVSLPVSPAIVQEYIPLIADQVQTS